MRARLKAIGVAVLMLSGCSAPDSATKSPATQSERIDSRIVRVESPEAFNTAVAEALPGDQIVLANGVWRDFDALLEANGTPEAPIQMRAETPGKVILSGQSSLRLAGEYLVVSDLVFRDGYTPRNEVISFRKDDTSLANYSRVERTVIDGYSNPDRTQRDLWVGLYGKNNMFDHNHLAGKQNAGPTLAVRLNSEESQQNGHKITYNYFGPRPVFGSNGGETLRIGTSHYSLTESQTLVEGNFFDRCSGEVEIISNKSGGNTFRRNTFYASRGTLTLRHGSGTLVENNLFDGAGAPYTGGVRVINANQTIRENYFKDLTGNRFSGALVVMNGVPDSPINRYHQVDGAVIENNTFDHVAAIELGEGSDAERTAVPVNSMFRNNLVFGRSDVNPINLYDDMSGIAFSGNVSASSPPNDIASGFKIHPESKADTGADRLSKIEASGASGPFGVAREDTGVSWYPKASDKSPFEGGRKVALQPGVDVLSDALSEAQSGDTFELAPGEYFESKVILLKVPVTIRGVDDSKPVLSFERPRLFVLTANAGLMLEGLTFSGRNAPDGAGNSLIGTSAAEGSGNHILALRDIQVQDFNVNKGFSIVSAGKGSFFDRIDVSQSSFKDISGVAFKLNQETDDYGIYNAEYLTIADSTFENMGEPIADIYRGGRDESTFGPHIDVSGSTFRNVGQKGDPLLRLYGLQHGRFTDNTVIDAGPIAITLTTGLPVITERGNARNGTANVALIQTEDLRNQK